VQETPFPFEMAQNKVSTISRFRDIPFLSKQPLDHPHHFIWRKHRNKVKKQNCSSWAINIFALYHSI